MKVPLRVLLKKLTQIPRQKGFLRIASKSPRSSAEQNLRAMPSQRTARSISACGVDLFGCVRGTPKGHVSKIWRPKNRVAFLVLVLLVSLQTTPKADTQKDITEPMAA